MKRDDELIRRLLIDLVESPEAYSEEFIFVTMSAEEKTRSYHLELLLDSGFILIQDERRFFINDEMPREEGRVFSRCRTFRVSNDGQDFYGATRDDGIWKKTKESASGLGVVALGILKDIAVGLVKHQLTEKLGIPIA